MQVPECHGSTSARNWLPPPARLSLGGALSARIRWIATRLFLSIVNARSAFKQRARPAKEEEKKKERKENSRPLMQTVKNNNQECSIREMHSPRLWVLQVDCTVITSPEDPGEESFHEKRGRTGKAGELHALQASLCSPPFLKQNMNANISSANRAGTQETLVLFFVFFCLPAMKCFCSHTRTPTHTWHMRMSRADLTREVSLHRFAEPPWGCTKELCCSHSSAAAPRLVYLSLLRRSEKESPVATLSEVWKHRWKLAW